MLMTEKDEIMDQEISVDEGVERIIKRLENGQIRPEYAKAQLHHMIDTVRTVEELNTAYTAYSRVISVKA